MSKRIEFIDQTGVGKAAGGSAMTPTKLDALAREYVDIAKERFFNKIIKHNNGCWIWIAAGQGIKSKYGCYGCFYFKGKRWQAHRVSFVLFKGEIPEGMLVCHSCDNRKCVNPDHLFLGTHSDNMKDCANKKRNWMQKPENRKLARAYMKKARAFQYGEKSGASKLTIREVIKIKKLLKTGLSERKIAVKFNISRPTIHQISKGKTWTKALAEYRKEEK